MPNHIHGIIILVGAGPCACPNRGPCACLNEMGQPWDMGQPRGVAPTMSLPDVLHRFKTMRTERYIDGVKQFGWKPFRGRLWQRNYYEHIIRTEESLNRIREYILRNPMRWTLDRENPYREGIDPSDERINDAMGRGVRHAR